MLKRIFSYMKQYKKYAFLALFCIAVEAVLDEIYYGRLKAYVTKEC